MNTTQQSREALRKSCEDALKDPRDYHHLYCIILQLLDDIREMEEKLDDVYEGPTFQD